MRSHARAFLCTAPVLALVATTLVAWESSPERPTARSHGSAAGFEVALATLPGTRGRAVPGATARPGATRDAALELTAPTPHLTATNTTSGRALDAGDTPHARERVHASQGPAAPANAGARDGRIPDGREGDELARIRGELRSADPRVRAEALRSARDLRSPELTPDVTLLLEHETDVPVRRLATQVLAQGDPAALVDLFHSLKKDKDPIVQANAAFGLARSGDESEQAWLLCLCEASRSQAPGLLPVVAAALEDPALKAPAVIQRFQQLADNPRVSQATRDRAQQVLKAKLGS